MILLIFEDDRRLPQVKEGLFEDPMRLIDSAAAHTWTNCTEHQCCACRRGRVVLYHDRAGASRLPWF